MLIVNVNVALQIVNVALQKIQPNEMKESTQNNMMKPFFTNKSQININEAIIEKGNKAINESRK